MPLRVKESKLATAFVSLRRLWCLSLHMKDLTTGDFKSLQVPHRSPSAQTCAAGHRISWKAFDHLETATKTLLQAWFCCAFESPWPKTATEGVWQQLGRSMLGTSKVFGTCPMECHCSRSASPVPRGSPPWPLSHFEKLLRHVNSI